MSDDPDGAVGWVRALVFEAEDLDRAAAFWQALLGVELIDRRDDWIQLGRDRGGIYLGFLPAQGGRPSSIRARPDIQVPDLDAATARVQELGGTLLSIDKDPEGEHRVMADTEGNEFTILGPLPHDEAERIGLA